MWAFAKRPYIVVKSKSISCITSLWGIKSPLSACVIPSSNALFLVFLITKVFDSYCGKI